MNSLKSTAHRAGWLYFFFMILGILGEFVFPTFVMPDDAAQTARNIAAAEPMYRLGVLLGFVTLVMFIYLVALLFRLFRDVDRNQAMIMVLLVTVGVSISISNLMQEMAPLVLLKDADALTAFTGPQQDALSLGFLRLHGSGTIFATAFWGLWLFPFGILVIRSGFLPRILGILLIVAGGGYVLFFLAALTLPEHRQTAFKILMPLFLGEVPIIFWLLIKGAKLKVPAPAAPEVS